MTRQLLRWNPYREIEDFLDRYRHNLSPAPAGNSQEVMTTADWQPVVDIREEEHAFLIAAELPGLKRDQVKVSVQDGVLTLSGERHAEKVEEDTRMHRVERSYGSFLRRFSLPENVRPEAIAANFEDGILKVHLPKADIVTPQAIDIKVN